MPTSSIQGHVDRVDNGAVMGWAFDRGAPNESIEVALLVDGVEVARSLAAMTRDDVAWVHGCTSRCGFKIPIPFERIGKQRFSVSVQEPRSGVVFPCASVADDEHQRFEVRLSDSARSSVETVRAIHRAFKSDSDVLVRMNHSPSIRLKGLDPLMADIFVINGARGAASELFRTYALAVTLKELGFTPLVFDVEDVPFLSPSRSIHAVFLVRVASDTEVSRFIDRVRRANIPVICDFDDLIFRPSLLDSIDGVRFLSDSDRHAYADGMRKYRKTVSLADIVCVTTERLASEAGEFNRNVSILPNFPLDVARDRSRQVAATPRVGEFVIGYYSGTLTHQADFRECAKSLARFLRSNPTARLRLVGQLDLSEFSEFSDLESVERVEILSYEDMIEDIARCHVVIAPLVISDPFCESKSELKFFDAALVGVPIIASATGPFSAAISHRVNGLLVTRESDWFESLDFLVRNPTARHAIGVEARRTVESRYSALERRRAVASVLERAGRGKAGLSVSVAAAPSMHRNPDGRTLGEPSKKRIAVLLPDIFPGSGGHRKVLTWCHHYARLGGQVEVLFVSNRTNEELRSIVREHFFESCGRVRAYDCEAPDAEILVATSWSTAYVVAEWDSAAEKFYFVQDFEPLFSPMSTDYALAFHSYRLALTKIPFGDWNRRKLAHEFGYSGPAVKFPVDHEVYFPRTSEGRRNTILFYARPSQPRRLFELGFHALRLVRPHLPGYRIVFFGEHIENVPDGFECVGKHTDLNVLADLYSSARIGIAFSTTNPSLIPFEMLACGLPVVDVDIGLQSSDFAECDALVRCEPTVDGLARTIYRLATDLKRCEELSTSAQAWARRLPSDLDFAESVLSLLGALTGQPGVASSTSSRVDA